MWLSIEKTEVYNPGSVVNYVKALWKNKEAIPNPYWANTSSNDIIKTLVEEADDFKRWLYGYSHVSRLFLPKGM